MSSVDVSINKALMIQERAAEKFIESSDTLNENIAATTGVVEKLATPIQSGLRAVSESSLKIGGIAKAVEASTTNLVEVVQQLKDLPETLAPLKNITEDHKALLTMLKPLSAISGIAKAAETSTTNLFDVVQQLKSLPEALAPLKNMTDDHKALIAMLKPLSETVKVQQAMLKLLGEIQRDRAPVPSVAAAATVDLDATPDATAA
jgi:DNA repair ATPase RecN